MTPGVVTERQLQQTVMDCLALFHWRAYHTWRSVNSEAGFPDVVACRRDRAIAIELKSETGTTTAAQFAWLASLQLAGLEVYTWRPADWASGTIERVLG